MEKKLYEQKILELEEANETLTRALDVTTAELVAVTITRDEWIAESLRISKELEAFRSTRFDRGSRLAS